MGDTPYNLIPLKSTDKTSLDYLYSLLKAYEVNKENECYDNAFLDAYLLFVYWLYSKIWFLTKTNPDKIKDIFLLHSYDSNFNESKFLRAEQPQMLALLKLDERKYSRIFRRLCLTDEESRLMRDLTDARNQIAHPNGIILCPDETILNSYLIKIEKLSALLSLHFGKKYLSYYTSNFGNIGIKSIQNWQTNLELELNLITQFQLAQIDVSSLVIAKKLALSSSKK